MAARRKPPCTVWWACVGGVAERGHWIRAHPRTPLHPPARAPQPLLNTLLHAPPQRSARPLFPLRVAGTLVSRAQRNFSPPCSPSSARWTKATLAWTTSPSTPTQWTFSLCGTARAPTSKRSPTPSCSTQPASSVSEIRRAACRARACGNAVWCKRLFPLAHRIARRGRCQMSPLHREVVTRPRTRTILLLAIA